MYLLFTRSPQLRYIPVYWYTDIYILHNIQKIIMVWNGTDGRRFHSHRLQTWQPNEPAMFGHTATLYKVISNLNWTLPVYRKVYSGSSRLVIRWFGFVTVQGTFGTIGIAPGGSYSPFLSLSARGEEGGKASKKERILDCLDRPPSRP